MSIFSGMNPLEAAAWVAGSVSLVVALINVLLTRGVQARREQHEVSIESVRADLLTALERHKAELATKQAQRRAVVEAQFEELRASQEIRIPLEKRAREHMSKTRSLLAKVYISFHRLADLAPKLDEEHILIETTNTLDLYAEYRQHLTTVEYVSYCDELKNYLTTIQKTLARIFLDLQIDEYSRNDQAVTEKIEASLKTLQLYKDRATSKIEALIRVHLVPLQRQALPDDSCSTVLGSNADV